MILTTQEREAIERGDAVPHVIPESHTECVLIRRDRLGSLSLLSDVDYSPCPSDDLLRITSECVEHEEQKTERRRNPASIIGLWKDANPLSDEEIDRILEEELVRKHG